MFIRLAKYALSEYHHFILLMAVADPISREKHRKNLRQLLDATFRIPVEHGMSTIFTPVHIGELSLSMPVCDVDGYLFTCVYLSGEPVLYICEHDDQLSLQLRYRVYDLQHLGELIESGTVKNVSEPS